MNKNICNLLQGYEKMNEFVEAERIVGLPALTIEEAKARYIQLCMVWEESKKRKNGNLKLLDRLKIEDMVKRRGIMDRIGTISQRGKYECSI
ncbi:MAG: hypothetical protein QME42_01685 [bacterium]|nr:hypothetical protein [bacterium]